MKYLHGPSVYVTICNFSPAIMSVFLSHHSGPVVVSAASNSHIIDYLAAERIRFKVPFPELLMHYE